MNEFVELMNKSLGTNDVKELEEIRDQLGRKIFIDNEGQTAYLNFLPFLDAKIASLQTMRSNTINRWIAIATITSVIATAFFSFLQYKN